MTPTSASAPQRIERGHIEDLVDEVIGAARGFDKGRKVGRVADATRPRFRIRCKPAQPDLFLVDEIARLRLPPPERPPTEAALLNCPSRKPAGC
jgi:hypothetical protein